nr:CoA-binding protein [Pseudomonas sp.]
MDALFRPRSIAIVGASSDGNKPGGKVASYLLKHGYQGTLVLISKSAGEIGGIPACPDIDAYEGTIDVAVLAIPAAAVPEALRKLAARQCRYAVVFASGFAELGEEGRALQHAMREQALASGIRLLGPNTQGFANLRDGVVCHFGTTLSETASQTSAVAVVSQSGAASQIVYSRLRDLGITPSFVTATGNEADISVSDIILWYLQDPAVDTVIAYAETLNDLPVLSDAARLAQQAGKSIIFVKAGRTASGAQAASSHTGALTVEDAIASSFFEQSGILRATNLKQAAELAQMLMLDIKPRLNRRALSISNSGASCVMSADAIESEGLSLASQGPGTVAALRATLPSYVNAGNPIDMTTATLQRP